jgi:hypothetical protein
MVLDLADVPVVAVIAVVAGQRRDIVGLDSDAREGQGVDVIARRRLVGKALRVRAGPGTMIVAGAHWTVVRKSTTKLVPFSDFYRPSRCVRFP